MTFMTLQPAYGRDYKTIKEAKAAWESGADFKIASIGADCGRYINATDAKRLPNTVFNIRFCEDRKIAVVRNG